MSSRRSSRLRVVLSFVVIGIVIAVGIGVLRGQREGSFWDLEDPASRNRLPEYRVIPGAQPQELTPALRAYSPKDYVTWTRSHGGSESMRFSALDQINRTNVKQLKRAWIHHTGDRTGNVQANPVIAEGLIFVPTPSFDVVALDAKTGKKVWHYGASADTAKRGITWWPGDTRNRSRIFFPEQDQLTCLDAKTGRRVASFGNEGRVPSFFSRIPPVIFQDKLVYATFKPSVEVLDLLTGRRLWEFSLKDVSVEDQARFKNTSFKFELAGAHPWGGMSLDAERGIAYVTTGNPTHSLVGVFRPGPNRHSNSVLALDIQNQKLLWSFQEIEHDLWDLDIPAPPILTSLTKDGRRVDVVVAVTKYGNTLLLDRLTGKPLFDFRYRRAPVSRLPGERTAPYQPFLELPEPFSKQVFSEDEITNLSPESRAHVSGIVKKANFGFFQPHALNVNTILFGLHGGTEWTGGAVDPVQGWLYVTSNDVPWKITIINQKTRDESVLPTSRGRQVYLDRCASCHGLNRQGGAGPSLVQVDLRVNEPRLKEIILKGVESMPPISGLEPMQLEDVTRYLLTRDVELAKIPAKADASQGPEYEFKDLGYNRFVDPEGYPASKPPWGLLNAINLHTGKMEWRIPYGTIPALEKRGIRNTGAYQFGAPIVTAGGLVFVSGTTDKYIRAYDKDTGEELWSYLLPFAGSAPPSTYLIDGKQYLVIPATGGGELKSEKGDAFVAFSL